MPIWYINPSKPRRAKAIKRPAAKRAAFQKAVRPVKLRPVRKGRRVMRLAKSTRPTRATAPKRVTININPKTTRKRAKAARITPVRRISMAKKKRKLSGAAKAAFLRRMRRGRLKAARKAGTAAPKRTVRRKMRRNPARVATPAYRAGWERTFGKPKKRKAAKPRKRKAASSTSTKSARPKKRTTAPKRARKGGQTTMAKKRRKRHTGLKATKRARRTIRYQRKRGKGLAKAYMRKHKMASNPKRRRRYRRNPSRAFGVKALKRARRTVRYQKSRRGKTSAKRYMRKYRMRSNPMRLVKGLVDVLKQAAPVVGGMALSRFGLNLITQHADKIPGSAVVGTHLRPLASLAMVVAAHFGTGKVKALAKYRTGLLIGFGVSAVDTVIKAYAPAQIQQYLAPGSDGLVYDSALAGMGAYEDVADYVQVSAEEDLADYVEVGEYVETADYGMGALPGRQIPVQALRHAVPSQRALVAIPSASDVMGDDNDLYQGVFKGGGGW